ncbi:ATP-binding protein [Variovorax sp. J31P207]|uniref:sensor histidine kinase n=1 Tax=Variovorax sp. J31P207 TaxID=3053510 RepID=UPI00257722F4|nr:ATP-binding protein [Variovorax sp. J31P207]MDM0066736.1 ATP-binding protein [Variovorax sp. J31P207]
MKLYHMWGTQSAPETPSDTRWATIFRRATRALAVMSHTVRQPPNVLQMRANPSGLSPVGTGQPALRHDEVDLGALVLDLVAASSARWASGRIRAERKATDPLICHADRIPLEQIVGNLLDNAMKSSPVGAEVFVRLSSENGFARLSVADSGCGIAQEFLPDVFGLFSQADTEAGGFRGRLGAGLALVHGLAVAHGGFVKATSAGLDRGAEFSVWLPLHLRA